MQLYLGNLASSPGGHAIMSKTCLAIFVDSHLVTISAKLF